MDPARTVTTIAIIGVVLHLVACGSSNKPGGDADGGDEDLDSEILDGTDTGGEDSVLPDSSEDPLEDLADDPPLDTGTDGTEDPSLDTAVDDDAVEDPDATDTAEDPDAPTDTVEDDVPSDAMTDGTEDPDAGDASTDVPADGSPDVIDDDAAADPSVDPADEDIPTDSSMDTPGDGPDDPHADTPGDGPDDPHADTPGDGPDDPHADSPMDVVDDDGWTDIITDAVDEDGWTDAITDVVDEDAPGDAGGEDMTGVHTLDDFDLMTDLDGDGVPDDAPLLITEIMVNPAALGDNQAEFVEVLNVSAVDIDIIGLTIRDDSRTYTIDVSMVLPAGGYLVFGRTALPGENYGVAPGDTPTFLYWEADIQLANPSPDFAEISYGGNAIHLVEYFTGAGDTALTYIGAGPDEGRSFAMSQDYIDAAAGIPPAWTPWCSTPIDAVWVYNTNGSNDDHGSPGDPNPVCP